MKLSQGQSLAGADPPSSLTQEDGHDAQAEAHEVVGRSRSKQVADLRAEQGQKERQQENRWERQRHRAGV